MLTKEIQTPAGAVTVPVSVHRYTDEEKLFEKSYFDEDGTMMTLKVKVRWGDSCKNGHNTLSITADEYEGYRWCSGGCQHDKILKHFPDLREAVAYHLVSTDGPMHYFANTTYLAGNLDFNGDVKGEQRRTKDGKLMWQRQSTYSIVRGDRPEGDDYLPILAEGKERQLDAAKRSAVWPDATDEELCASKAELERKLAERLPALLANLKRIVEGFGFTY